mgnify:FL=1
MVTLTKLLEIRMVASSFSGLERISLTLSAISGSSNLSKSVSLSEKKASSEPEAKADMQRHSIAAKQAMMLEVSGMLKDIMDCALLAAAIIREKIHDNGSVSKIIYN